MSVSTKHSDLKPNLMDTAMLSIFLNIPKATLAKWRCTGEVNIPFLKIGNAVRYNPDDVQQWLKENTEHKSKERA